MKLDYERLKWITISAIVLNLIVFNKYSVILIIFAAIFWIKYFIDYKVFKKINATTYFFTSKVFRKERNEFYVELENNSKKNIVIKVFPANNVNNIFPHTRIVTSKKNSRMKVAFNCFFDKRGKHKINNGSISYEDSLGLYSFSKELKNDKEIKVLPENVFAAFKKEELKKLIPEVISKYMVLEDNTYIEKINEYNNEPMNKIHWKLSAKMDELMVKKYSYTSTGKVYIFLDLNIEENSVINNYIWQEMRKKYEEFSIFATLAIIKDVMERNEEIRLTVNGENVIHEKSRYYENYYNLFSDIKGADNAKISFSEVFESMVSKLTLEDTVIIISMYLNGKIIQELIKARSRSSKVIVLLMPYAYRLPEEPILKANEMYRKEVLEFEKDAEILRNQKIIVRIVSYNETLLEVFESV
jgi:uncharacterized protein (DUF58 family)